jgi:hypothetical protein
MNSEYVRIWKQRAMTNLKIMSHYVPVETYINHVKYLSIADNATEVHSGYLPNASQE